MALSGVYKTFNDRWCNQTVWIYSDPHFGDKDSAKKALNRPTDEEQVRMINAKVGRKDTIIFLGDIGDVEYAKQVKGYKVLICGNHDVGITNYEGVFDEVYEGPLMIGEKLILSHQPVEVPWAFNIHGHLHKPSKNEKGLNVCSDVINYTPVNLNQILKKGLLSHTPSIHRQSIDYATKRANRRKVIKE